MFPLGWHPTAGVTMTTKQIEPPQSEEDTDNVVSVEALEKDDEIVLELLKELEGQALTKDEIAERLGWENPYRVSTSVPDIMSFELYMVSSRYHDGTKYYYAKLDSSQVFFLLMIPASVVFMLVLIALEYGLI